MRRRVLLGQKRHHVVFAPEGNHFNWIIIGAQTSRSREAEPAEAWERMSGTWTSVP